MHTKLQCRVGYYQFADSFISTANLSNRPINCYYRRWSTVSRRDFPTGGGVNKREGPAPPPPDKSDRAAVMLIYTDSSPEPTPPSPIVHLEFNVSTMVGLHGGKVNEGRDRGSTFTGGGGEGASSELEFCSQRAAVTCHIFSRLLFNSYIIIIIIILI
jgi:hypothetical protein